MPCSQQSKVPALSGFLVFLAHFLALLLVACGTTQAPKTTYHTVPVGNCWYKTADITDVACYDVGPGGSSYCWEYKVKEGDWDARCQEDLLERYKREGCKFVRLSEKVVAVSCPK